MIGGISMSGKKGMKQYPISVKSVIINEHQNGVSVLSLSKKYGISRYAIQSWCGLRPEVEIRQTTPKRKGRRPQGESTSEYDLLLENKRLTMENELLKSFLQLAGRR